MNRKRKHYEFKILLARINFQHFTEPDTFTVAGEHIHVFPKTILKITIYEKDID